MALSLVRDGGEQGAVHNPEGGHVPVRTTARAPSNISRKHSTDVNEMLACERMRAPQEMSMRIVPAHMALRACPRIDSNDSTAASTAEAAAVSNLGPPSRRRSAPAVASM